MTAKKSPLDALSDSSDDELDQTPEMVERRQRALQLLAKAFHKPAEEGAPSAAAEKQAADEETRFLQSLLSTPADEMARCVRDRLSVLSVTKGGVQVAATKKAPAAATAAVDPPAAEPKAARLPDLLKRLSDGDVSAVSTRILSDDYWASLVRERLGTAADPILALSSSNGTFNGNGTVERKKELAVPAAQLSAMADSLDMRGYGMLKPGGVGGGDGSGWVWDNELQSALRSLEACANALKAYGWPPAFVFALPGAWRIIDKLFVPMASLLGEGCEMDPSVFCWIAAKPPPLNATTTTNNVNGSSNGGNNAAATKPPGAGANFGVPHRDFTCLQSLRKSDGKPTLLSVWLPLNNVTTENGSMMVIPKQLDPHFHKRFAYAHMRPALPPDEEEKEEDGTGMTEVRFNLAAARPLAPLPPGSIVAWVGNLIHWGTCCLPDADAPPRVSVGFNFMRKGERLQSGAPTLTREAVRGLGLPERLALIARSVLAYSPWYKLEDTAVPPEFFPDMWSTREESEYFVS